MTFSFWWVEQWAPRVICFPVRVEWNRSAWLIQDAPVSMKWRCHRGRMASQLPIGAVS